MTTAVQKIKILSVSQEIPFNKLILSQSNIRRTKAGVSIEELADDIAHRGLLQNLNVRPVLDTQGAETAMFEVPAGGRRFQALQLLVKQKRLAKTAPVRCNVKKADDPISAEEDSLAENVQRAPLHPLDQFRAFQILREQGLGEETIAARFFVSATVVKQRLKLAAVSEKLLDAYAEDEMTLEQLMAFTVSDDQARQEQVWGSLAHVHQYNKEPRNIRSLLTEDAVDATDKRARFVGIAAYQAAGGIVARDLFEEDDGGWLQDPALLNRLVTEKLQSEASKLASEGWKWITIAPDFPYGHNLGLSRIAGETIEMTDEERANRESLREEFDRLEEQYSQADEYPDEVDQRLGEIETALAAFENRPVRYEPTDIARAGVFVSIDGDGDLCIERGYLRPEDGGSETDASGEAETSEGEQRGDGDAPITRTLITLGGEPNSDADEEEEGIRPLSDRLVTELTAHRTLALRDALANAPDVALVAVLHALCLSSFYRFGADSCLELSARSVGFNQQAPGLNDCKSAKAIAERHENWAQQLPEQPAGLWTALLAFDNDSRAALFAHCASLSVNVVKEPHHRRPGALAHGDVLARAVNLDMAAAGWSAAVGNYLGRVPKVRVLEAVREGAGDASAQLIEHLKKPEMAKEAERLLTGTGWLPEPLRTPDLDSNARDAEVETLPAFLADDEDEADAQMAAAE